MSGKQSNGKKGKRRTPAARGSASKVADIDREVERVKAALQGDATEEEFVGGLLKRTKEDSQAREIIRRTLDDPVSRQLLLSSTDPLLLATVSRAGVMQEAVKSEIARARFGELRSRLGEQTAPIEEKLLIDKAIACYFDYVYAFDQHIQKADKSEGNGRHWDRRLTQSARRLDDALMTLAKIRRLSGRPVVQVNIATDGSQQVVQNTMANGDEPNVNTTVNANRDMTKPEGKVGNDDANGGGQHKNPDSGNKQDDHPPAPSRE